MEDWRVKCIICPYAGQVTVCAVRLLGWRKYLAGCQVSDKKKSLRIFARISGVIENYSVTGTVM